MIGQEGSPIEIAKQEIGPCYSRWADDCFELSSKQLQERGLYANCEQLIQAKEMSSAEDWNSYINEIPYCDGYFAYDRMPDGRGEGTGRKKTKDNTALAVGAGVAVVVLGLLAGPNSMGRYSDCNSEDESSILSWDSIIESR